jgi:hypothetical protein
MIAVKSGQQSAVAAQWSDSTSRVSTGWDVVDRALAPGWPGFDSDALAKIAHVGLARSAIHEWFCDERGNGFVRRGWLPPHSLFIHFAYLAIAPEASDVGLIIWIGRRIWPHAASLWRAAWPGCDDFSIAAQLLNRSVFINPPDDASRVWAIDLALRSAAVKVVLADGSRLKMAESRRLQLAAERGKALALLARPGWEVAELSAAATRWRVRRTPSSSSAPRWIVELLRCKQSQGRSGSAMVLHNLSRANSCGDADAGGWEVEYAAPGHLRLVADVVDRSDSKDAAAINRFRARA